MFKHKYLTNPEITPEDKLVAAAQILTQTIKGNVTGESEEMEALEKVAEIFETIANRKSRKKKEKTITNIQLDCQDAPMHYLQGWPKQMCKMKEKRVEEPPPRVDALSTASFGYLKISP